MFIGYWEIKNCVFLLQQAPTAKGEKESADREKEQEKERRFHKKKPEERDRVTFSPHPKSSCKNPELSLVWLLLAFILQEFE